MSEYEWTPEQAERWADQVRWAAECQTICEEPNRAIGVGCDLIRAADARMRQQDERIAALEALVERAANLQAWTNLPPLIMHGVQMVLVRESEWRQLTTDARAALAPKE